MLHKYVCPFAAERLRLVTIFFPLVVSFSRNDIWTSMIVANKTYEFSSWFLQPYCNKLVNQLICKEVLFVRNNKKLGDC